MSIKSNFNNICNYKGVEGVVVVSDGEPLMSGDGSLLDSLSQTLVLYSVIKKTSDRPGGINVRGKCDGEDFAPIRISFDSRKLSVFVGSFNDEHISVAHPKGHEVAKSLRRALRRASRSDRAVNMNNPQPKLVDDD